LLYGAPASHVELGVAEDDIAGLSGRRGLRGALGDQRALLPGQRREELQHEGIHIRAKLSDYKRHLVSDEAEDEVCVSAEPVEPGHAFELLCRS